MKIRYILLAGIALAVLIVGTSSQASWWPFSKSDDEEVSKAEPTEIDWGALIPEDFVQPENPFSTMSQEEIDKLLDGSDESNAEIERLEKLFTYAPVVEELDGVRVKLPAYITPLEFDGSTSLNEFLLVPYLGACIHTPPPPANQVVHADPDKSVEVENLYDPVWAIGTIRTETVRSDLAESGYRLEVEKIIPYTVPEE